MPLNSNISGYVLAFPQNSNLAHKCFPFVHYWNYGHAYYNWTVTSNLWIPRLQPIQKTNHFISKSNNRDRAFLFIISIIRYGQGFLWRFNRIFDKFSLNYPIFCFAFCGPNKILDIKRDKNILKKYRTPGFCLIW